MWHYWQFQSHGISMDWKTDLQMRNLKLMLISIIKGDNDALHQ